VGWLTPLGEVPVDAGAVRALAQQGHVVVDDRPHAPEHSLEVQLPFLQRALPPGIAVLPIAVGRSSVDRVAATLAATVEPGTIVLCSTDLSHYLDQAAARRQDDQTARAVLELAAERIGIRDACGAFALRGLVAWARGNALRPRLLGLGTSADTIGDPARVVGYAAFAFAGFVTPPSGDRPVKTFGQ
jgi:AmmeMemoRadiSam system protein B